MFDMIDTILKDSDNPKRQFIVMGQICIHKDYRGKGLFPRLYQDLQDRNANTFNSIITEIATRNTRSMHAHKKVGFQILKTFSDATDEWAIVEWKWPRAD